MLKRLLKTVYYKCFELPLTALPDRPALTTDWPFRIPNVLYQTWEDRFFGKSHFKRMQEFRALNPDLTFILYSKSDRDSFIKDEYGNHPISEIYERSLFGPMKADIFRYCILYRNGGFYCDINKAVWKQLSGFLDKHTGALLSYEGNALPVLPNRAALSTMLRPDKFVLQSVFGFTEGHPVLKVVLDNIVEYHNHFVGKTFAAPKEAIVTLTGPGMLTKTLREMIADCNDIKQIDVDFERTFEFNLKGANVRHATSRAYTDIINSPILR